MKTEDAVLPKITLDQTATQSDTSTNCDNKNNATQCRKIPDYVTDIVRRKLDEFQSCPLEQKA